MVIPLERVSLENKIESIVTREGEGAAMKRMMAMIVVASILGSPRALAGTTESTFTYQGRLMEGGSPANGTYSIDAKLWTAVSGGTQIGATLSFPSVGVGDGLFTLELDFGTVAFDNSNRWLEVIVNGMPLAPRQPITRTPYAIQTRGIFVDDNLNVGIGTDNPRTTLHVRSGDVGSPFTLLGNLMIERNNNNLITMMTPANRFSGIVFGRPGSTTAELQHGAIIYNEAGSLVDTMQFRTAGNLTRMVIDENGRVGIGVTNPAEEFHIVGDSRFDGQTLFLDRAYAIADLQVNGLEDGAFVVGSNDQGLKMDVDTIQAMNFITFEGTHIPSTLELNPAGGTVAVANPNFGLDGSLKVGGGGIGTNSVSIGDVDDNGQLQVNTTTLRVLPGEDGFVGINIFTPAFQLHVNGSAGKPGGGSWSNSSDVRLKKNVQPLDGTLDSLLSLQGVSFEYVDPKAINELPGTRIGMVAQQVEQVFPDWVEERADGYKTVTYRGFEALTVEAMRELRDEKNAEIEALQQQIDDLKAMVQLLLIERAGDPQPR
jgi:hypothetical protein